MAVQLDLDLLLAKAKHIGTDVFAFQAKLCNIVFFVAVNRHQLCGQRIFGLARETDRHLAQLLQLVGLFQRTHAVIIPVIICDDLAHIAAGGFHTILQHLLQLPRGCLLQCVLIAVQIARTFTRNKIASRRGIHAVRAAQLRQHFFTAALQRRHGCRKIHALPGGHLHTVGRQQIGLFALFHLLITPGVHGIQKIVQRCLHL